MDLCEISSDINAKRVGIILCLVTNATRTPPRSKKPCVLSYTRWEKPRLAFLAKLLGVSRTTTYYWIRPAASSTDEPTIAPDIRDIEFDEMWHFIQSKKEKSGLLKPWIVAQGEPLPGYSVVVMLQHSDGSTINSNI